MPTGPCANNYVATYGPEVSTNLRIYNHRNIWSTATCLTICCMQHIVRHTLIEDIHAGLVPITRTGDYTDVTVTDADGRQIPWPEVSHIDDNAMRDFMRQVVDRVYTFEVRAKDPGFLERIERWAQIASRWDEPKLDPSFVPALTKSRTLP